MLINFYNVNYDRIYLNFSFFSSGLAIIKKVSSDPLLDYSKIITRENSIKNFTRKIWKYMTKK